MTYFSQELPNVLGRTPRNHLARPQDHGTQITEIRRARNSTLSRLNGRANTSAVMSQPQTHFSAATPAKKQFPTTDIISSHSPSPEAEPDGHRSTPSVPFTETAIRHGHKTACFSGRDCGAISYPKGKLSSPSRGGSSSSGS